MASHHHHHHCQPSPFSAPTHCCYNPPPPSPPCSCCSSHLSPPPPPSTDHLLQAIASLLSQPAPVPSHLYTETQCSEFYTRTLPNQIRNQYQSKNSRNRLNQQRQQQEQQQTHYSAIASLLGRIEALESSLLQFSHSSCSLRDAAARIIQTHFRSFLVRRSRTLRQLKDLAFIKSSFNSLKSSFSNESHIDFAVLSHKAMDLLLKLDSIRGDDPMIRDGKRSITRDLVQFLGLIEGVAVKKHWHYVKATKNARFGNGMNKTRKFETKHGNFSDDQRILLENLRNRVEKISRYCKLSENDEEDVEHEGIQHFIDDDDEEDNGVLVGRKIGFSQNKNGVSVQRHGVQPKVKKSVSFAENKNVSKVFSNTYEPVLSEVVTCLDGSSSSDDQGDHIENHSCEVEDVTVSSQMEAAEDGEEVLADHRRSPESSDGERISTRRVLNNGGRNEMKGQVQAQKERLIFSAPLPVKMESRADLKSKGVRILT